MKRRSFIARLLGAAACAPVIAKAAAPAVPVTPVRTGGCGGVRSVMSGGQYIDHTGKAPVGTDAMLRGDRAFGQGLLFNREGTYSNDLTGQVTFVNQAIR